MSAIIVTGTDTEIGKTVFRRAYGCAGASYWKPVQAGTDDEGHGDAETVASLSGRPVLPSAYRLKTPCSPHLAAEIDGVTIERERLALPQVDGPLVAEGAGALVPVTRELLFADLFAHWGRPVVLVARTGLGTINHSLLSIEALRSRGVPILGVAFVGEGVEDSEATIAAIGGVKRLGRLPRLATLTRETLAEAFAAHFDVEDFR